MSERIELTEAEREALARAFHDVYCTSRDEDEHPLDQDDIDAAADMTPVVEAIIAARLESVERERDRYLAKWEGADDGWGDAIGRAEKAEAQLITARDALAAIEAYAEAERVRANEAETALAELRAKVEALADSYRQYETDVWGEGVAHNLRALLD